MSFLVILWCQWLLFRSFIGLDQSYNNLSGYYSFEPEPLDAIAYFEVGGKQVSGSISDLSLPSLQDFNVLGNALASEIHNLLLGFHASAFEKNSVLCGVSLEKYKLVSSDPTWPKEYCCIVAQHNAGGN
ncbi:putative leucine-rich repeat receptor-like protein kinase [Forsythia ovata]|uniref:Leucine-rich repeat receptor-like protein kinase n=1 Tax=Forsythia ovata TaxID=205694 RepID=A0ABD1QPH8_9LAMI